MGDGIPIPCKHWVSGNPVNSIPCVRACVRACMRVCVCVCVCVCMCLYVWLCGEEGLGERTGMQ